MHVVVIQVWECCDVLSCLCVDVVTYMYMYICSLDPHENTACVMHSHTSCDCMVIQTFHTYMYIVVYINMHVLPLSLSCSHMHTEQHNYYYSRQPFILHLHVLPIWFSSSKQSVAGTQWQRRFWSCGGRESSRVCTLWPTQIL